MTLDELKMEVYLALKVNDEKLPPPALSSTYFLFAICSPDVGVGTLLVLVTSKVLALTSSVDTSKAVDEPFIFTGFK